MTLFRCQHLVHFMVMFVLLFLWAYRAVGKLLEVLTFGMNRKLGFVSFIQAYSGLLKSRFINNIDTFIKNKKLNMNFLSSNITNQLYTSSTSPVKTELAKQGGKKYAKKTTTKKPVKKTTTKKPVKKTTTKKPTTTKNLPKRLLLRNQQPLKSLLKRLLLRNQQPLKSLLKRLLLRNQQPLKNLLKRLLLRNQQPLKNLLKRLLRKQQLKNVIKTTKNNSRK